MARYCARWHVNSALIPANPEERMKLWQMMLERVNAEIKAGEMEAWGITPSFNGYTIRVGDEKAVMAATSGWAPFILVDSFEPILTPEEALDAMKRPGAKK